MKRRNNLFWYQELVLCILMHFMFGIKSIFFLFGIKSMFISLFYACLCIFMFNIHCISFCLFSIGIINWYHNVSIYNFIVWFVFAPLLMNWQKAEKVFGVLYMHMFILLPRLCKKGEKNLVNLCIFISFYEYMCCLVYAYHWISLLFIAMHELRGSFYEA